MAWSLPLSAASPENEASADAAVSYFAATQLPSGGWDTSDPADFSCGFSTVDVALAIVQAGQTGPSWSATEADAAVAGVSTGGDSAWDYLDEQAEGLCGTPSVGKAAQMIILAVATDHDPGAFDPAGDGTPVDLVAILDAGIGDGSYGSIYTAPFAAGANIALGRSVPAATVDWLLAQQNPDGGFETGFGADSDSTALTIVALVAGGVSPSSDPIQNALGFLASLRNDDGGFTSFAPGDPSSPNSTGLVILGVTAAGYDVNEACWSGVAESDYVSPDQYLRSTQAADGSWSGFSPVFASAQAVQGLLRSYLPSVVGPAIPCELTVGDPGPPGGPDNPADDPPTGDPGEAQVGGDTEVPATPATLPATGLGPVTTVGLMAAALLILLGTVTVLTSRRVRI